MIGEDLVRDFKRKVCDGIEVEAEGLDRFIVYTPFMFDDGDHFVIVLKKQNGDWYLTDEGHTFMHISYKGLDFDTGTRRSVIDKTVSMFDLENREGELRLRVPNEQFGDALFSFSQALMKVADTTYWTRERVASTFYEDFRALLERQLEKFRPRFDYTDPLHDPRGSYPIDCFINGRPKPILIFGIKDETKLLQAAVFIRQFREWGFKPRSIGIFEDQTKISAKKLPLFTDVADKPYSSLAAAEMIGQYVSDFES